MATQILSEIRPVILQQQSNHQRKRNREKQEAASGQKKRDGTDWYTDMHNDSSEKCTITELTDEEANNQFWNETTDYTPESRIEIHEHISKEKRKEEEKRNPPKPKKERHLKSEDGRIYNINEAKVDFSLDEDDESVSLDISIFKFLDTSLCDVDVQPKYIKVTIKGQILQLNLPTEVKPDSSSAKRSQITGHLLITMPKLHPIKVPTKLKPKEKAPTLPNAPERLEIDPKSKKEVDITNIVNSGPKKITPLLGSSSQNRIVAERPNSKDFVDDPDVPPLE